MNDRPTPETDLETNYCDAMPDMPWVDAEVARKLERERDEAREDAAHWKTEYEIVVARLCGKKHPRDNGIISEHEIIPKLTQERDSARDELAALKRTAHWLYSRLRIYLDGEQFIGTAQRLERVGEENPWMKEPYNP